MTNQMGDVISITDANGEELVEYEYDEWGKTISVMEMNDNGKFFANTNPIRYRGYYYDTETGYYYLQSRYYDPIICRFINSDVPAVAKFEKTVWMVLMYLYIVIILLLTLVTILAFGCG